MSKDLPCITKNSSTGPRTWDGAELVTPSLEGHALYYRTNHDIDRTRHPTLMTLRSHPSFDLPTSAQARGELAYDAIICKQRNCPDHPSAARPQPHINLLPPEILGEIFDLCTSSDFWPSPAFMQCPPISLSHVCSYWRTVATSVSSLWSRIAVCTYRRHLTPAWLPLWLERSQNRPLSLLLRAFELAPLLFSHFDRWNTLSVVLDDNRDAREFLALPLTNAPALLELSITARKLCNIDILDEIITFAHSLVSVRRLSWRSECAPNTFSDFSFPRLTHLDLNCPIPMNDFLRILSSSPQLVHVVAQNIQSPSTQIVTGVTLPHLVTLEIKSEKDTYKVLDSLTLPSLRGLKLVSVSGDRGVWYGKSRVLDGLVLRSSCTLKALELFDHNISEADLLGYLTLPCLQSVTKLNIYAWRVRDHVLAPLICLNAEGEGVALFPYLTHLTLNFCSATDGLFADVIASRWAPARRYDDGILPAKLDFVCVVFESDRGRSPHGIDITRLETFMNQGLDIRWA